MLKSSALISGVLKIDEHRRLLNASLKRVVAFAVMAPLHTVVPLRRGIPVRFERLPLPSPSSGARLDALLRGHFSIGVPPSPPPLSLLARWLRLRLLRVYGGNGHGAERRPRASLSSRLCVGDVLVAHSITAAALRPVVGSGGVNASFDRAGPTMRSPAWISGCVRWAGGGLVAIAKPAGVPCQAGSGLDNRATVDYWLPAIAREAAKNSDLVPVDLYDRDSCLRLVHRLDADVSGLLLLACGRIAAERVRAALTARSGLAKEYLALVAAPLPIGVPVAGRITAAVSGVDALTEYAAEPLVGGRYTLLLLRPVTGRKHQLRLHVRELWRGTASIVGDLKYGFGETREEWAADAQPLMLHAWRLHLSGTVLGAVVPMVLPGKRATDAKANAAAPTPTPLTMSWFHEVRDLCMRASPAAATIARASSVAGGGVVLTDQSLPNAFRERLCPFLVTSSHF